MKGRKIKTCFGLIVLLALFLTACSGSAKLPDKDPNENVPVPEGTTLVDYKFHLTQLPYGSEGLKIKAQVKIGSNNYVYDIATVTSCTADAFIDKTVKLPNTYDALTFFFIDDNNKAKYYISIKDVFINKTTGVYEIDGYYCYYYDTSSPYKPYIAVNEAHFKELELNKEYSFNYRKEGYIVGYFNNVKGRKIKVEIKENKTEDKKNTNTYWYASSDITKIMTYDCDALYSFSTYNSEEDKVYIMVKPQKYDFSVETEKTGITIKFYIDIPIEDACLTIDQSCFASDGCLYATGEYMSEKSKKKLYKIDPKTNERVLYKEFEGDISYIYEYEPGNLLVAYSIKENDKLKSSNISKIDLATDTVSVFAEGIELVIESIISYENDRLVLFTKDLESTGRSVYLLDAKTGTGKVAPDKCFAASVHTVKEAYYVPEHEIILYSVNGSPRDIAFFRIDETEADNPQVYGFDSQYHTEYEMHYPHRLFSTNPLEVINGDGDIFTIDIDFIDSVPPVDEQNSGGLAYHNKIKDWCIWNRNIGFTYDDFIACGDYFYIMKIDKKDAYYENNTIVEKRSFAEPGTIINTVTFEEENGIRLWKCDQKLYVQTTDWCFPSGTYNAQDKIIFHEIDF